MVNSNTSTRVVKAVCYPCHSQCGVLVHVQNGQVIKIEGDPEHPENEGAMCVRGLAFTQLLYHPDRLKYPMKRVGQKGEGKWQRITWEEAYRKIAEEFNWIKEKHGPESVIFCHGTGRDIGPYLTKLAYSFGSPNRVCFGPLDGHACFAPKLCTVLTTTGAYQVTDCSQFFPDRYDNPNWKAPECIILWGNNPLTSNPDGFLGHWIIECMKRGSEIIVVDPKRTWLATCARIWMQIRPGTDAALALSMLNVIINEGIYDEEFVRKWTHGFDQLKERVQDYTLEMVAEITWIPKEKIIQAARLYAKSKPAAIQWGVAIDQTKECIPTIHAIMSLWAITGNLDVPGGNVIVRGMDFGLPTIRTEFQTMSEEQKGKKIGIRMYPLLDEVYSPTVGSAVIEQILTGRPYPIKAAWIQTTNTFACAAADPRRFYEAFRTLDFVTVVDLFLTPTAMAFADIVLPAATYAERDGISLTGGITSCLGTINKAIEPVGECKSDMEINLEIGKRLNPEAWPWDNVQEMFSSMIRPLGKTFKDLRETGFYYAPFEYRKYEKGLLRPDQKPGFNTPTGKVE